MSTDRLITVQGFLEQFRQQHQHRQEKPFCFVLGAGASHMSKIPTGGELALEWLRDLHRDLDFAGQTLETWAKESTLGIPNFDLKQISSFYSELYEKRFHDSPESGYAYLEDVMRDKEPSYGYSVLAYLLSETRHKIVITTNFDNLVADALSIHSTVFPLVVGHDSLAHYARVELRRPLIAKVHGGLGFAPKNAPGELSCLTDGWCKALERIFERCSPIVIGYDGNDGSLMTLLESMPAASIDNLRWCFYSPGDQHEENLKRVPQRVINFVERQHGRLVPIPGFDEIMLLLQRHLNDVMPMPNLGERMQERAKKRHEIYIKQEGELNDRVVGKVKSNPHIPPSKASSSVDALLKEAMDKLAKSNDIKPWWQWENEASAAASDEEKDRIYRAALTALPQSSELMGNYASFIKNERKDMEKAEELYKRAIETEPSNANNLGNYANFLTTVRKDLDKAEELYKRAIEIDPKRGHILCNYAIFLQNERKEMDKAAEYYKRAVRAEPTHAKILCNYANFLHHVRKDMEKSEEYYKRAIEADPTDAHSLCRYAGFIKNERKDMEKVEEFLKRAVEADPRNARTLASYAVFLQHERKDMERAEKLYERAIEIGPKNANTLGNYAQFCFLHNRIDEGLKLVAQAEAQNSYGPDLRSELIFYRLAHDHQAWPSKLHELAQLLGSGARSLDWPLEGNIAQAEATGHPNPDLLRAIAGVISRNESLEGLSKFPEWPGTTEV